MRSYVPVVFTLLFILLIDFYTIKGIFLLRIKKKSLFYKKILPLVFIISGLFFLLSQLWLFTNPSLYSGPDVYSSVFTLLGLFVLVYLPKTIFCIFHFLEDILWFLIFLIYKFGDIVKPSGKKIILHSRKHGIKIISKIGAVISLLLFFALLYSMIFGRFDFQVKQEIVYSNKLPECFNGIKIVQISDLHAGSFGKHKNKLTRAVQKINSLDPDFVFFTGDMINNYAGEMEGWVEILSEIKAQIGKYSILGNHDYGNYSEWDSEFAKEQNLNELIKYHKKIGFELLENESVTISIQNQSINILGVENWGLPPFPIYGDLKKATSEAEMEFKILLSHDPSHWAAEVVPETDIDITFSGHTHGFQFGVDLAWFQWSPVQYKYPHWAGLYSNGGQYLYVNKGLGYVGFPGRFGSWPEITLVELRTVEQ